MTPEILTAVVVAILSILKKHFCKYDYVFIRMLYGGEINVHNGKRHEYRCKKCGMYKWD